MKVAIVGTAPHRSEAPFDDPEWTIWACSPKNIGQVPRFDAWFELHDVSNPIYCPAHLASFLNERHAAPVYMQERFWGSFPDAKPFPFARLTEKYGECFFTSSIAWMLAFALEQDDIERIGIYGVDMGHATEYQDQRWGCQHFMALAKARGIPIDLPPASKLATRSRLYGLEDMSPAERAMRRRVDDLKKAEQQNRRNADMQLGAITAIEDILRAEFPPN